jgi:small subunit ribosomal protein S16
LIRILLQRPGGLIHGRQGKIYFQELNDMAVKLRLKRMGRTHGAFFRLNAIDSRTPRDGRVIEELGYYDPCLKDSSKQFVAKLDRCKYWLDNGAVPSETVSSLLKKSGIEHNSLRLPKPGKPKIAAETPKADATA